MRFHPLLVAFVAVTLISSGCTTLRLPKFMPGMGLKAGGGSNLADAQLGTELRGSDSARAYKMVAEAKSRNAIVLHVPGDDEPMRVLPLPSDGQSVFVSDLLRQSGIQRKIGRVQAILYRASAESLNGVRMAVTMAPDGKSVRPEGDYALQAGDRLEVSEAPPKPLTGFASSILGI